MIQEISFNYAEEMAEKIVPKQYLQLHNSFGVPSIYRQCKQHIDSLWKHIIICTAKLIIYLHGNETENSLKKIAVNLTSTLPKD